MRPQRRILIAVTHLLGVGHLQRMASLARALVRTGHSVLLVSGGRPNPAVDLTGIPVEHLPSVACRGTDFSTLYDETGAIASSAQLERRGSRLASLAGSFRPEVVITELYPFGRRNLTAEFEALLAEAERIKPRPAILASIRDVLNPPAKPGRPASVLARLAKSYDGVLVHGDEALIPLEESWPVEPALKRRLAYVGYLKSGSGSTVAAGAERRGIIVSGGGSAAGMRLYRAALEAAHRMPEQHWHVLVGHGVSAEAFAALLDSCPANATVERARPDFAKLLAGAALSISQAGYNTILDLAEAGTRALLVPFAEGTEREQTIRAAALAERGFCSLLDADEMDGERLAQRAEKSLAAPIPDWSALRLDGAARAVTAIETAAERAAARASAWSRLDSVLGQAERARAAIPVFIRDDDAIAATPELDRFLALLDRWALPVAIAAIPGRLEASLIERCRARAETDLLVHGLSHRNHAPESMKKAEFGAHRPPDMMRAELREAKDRLHAVAGTLGLPVLVPPWNRIAPELVTALPGLGYRGLSTFADPKPGDTPPGLIRHNTHWDPIEWRGGGGLREEAALIDELAGLIGTRIASAAAGKPEPMGLLTHHLVHDGWIERFLGEVFERLARSPAIRFVSARAIFPAQ
jgi:predicted glycosyltransferase